MSFGQNLQFLRKMSNRMTQEELAEKLNVSRQTVSKWELDTVYPEISKIVEICNLFSCSMDQLIREDINPFRLIPNAYKVLMAHMKLKKTYFIDGVEYMDVYIAVEA